MPVSLSDLPFDGLGVDIEYTGSDFIDLFYAEAATWTPFLSFQAQSAAGTLTNPADTDFNDEARWVIFQNRVSWACRHAAIWDDVVLGATWADQPFYDYNRSVQFSTLITKANAFLTASTALTGAELAAWEVENHFANVSTPSAGGGATRIPWTRTVAGVDTGVAGWAEVGDDILQVFFNQLNAVIQVLKDAGFIYGGEGFLSLSGPFPRVSSQKQYGRNDDSHATCADALADMNDDSTWGTWSSVLALAGATVKKINGGLDRFDWQGDRYRETRTSDGINTGTMPALIDYKVISHASPPTPGTFRDLDSVGYADGKVFIHSTVTNYDAAASGEISVTFNDVGGNTSTATNGGIGCSDADGEYGCFINPKLLVRITP
jgi:hypothetical protein